MHRNTCTGQCSPGGKEIGWGNGDWGGISCRNALTCYWRKKSLIIWHGSLIIWHGKAEQVIWNFLNSSGWLLETILWSRLDDSKREQSRARQWVWQFWRTHKVPFLPLAKNKQTKKKAHPLLRMILCPLYQDRSSLFISFI